jgi:hypothetical protein
LTTTINAWQINYTNIPEVTENGNAVFKTVKGAWNFLAESGRQTVQ